MRPTFRIGRVFGIELGIHYSWVLIAALIVFSLAAHFHATNGAWPPVKTWGAALITGILFFAGLILHELAHALVARAHHLPIHRITLFFLGGMAQIEQEPEDASTEFWMAIVGPATSFVLGVLLLYGAYLAGWVPHGPEATPAIAVLVWLGYINVALAVFNMIPGFPMDGGRVLRAIIWLINKDARRSTMIAGRIGQIIGVLFILYGLFRFFGSGDFGALWISLIGWFLLEAAGGSIAQVEITRLLRGLRVRDLMSQDCGTVKPTATVQEFVETEILHTGRRCCVVTDNGHMLGLITPQEVRTVERERWPLVVVREIMRPIEQVKTVAPDAPIRAALDIMGRADVAQLPVTSNGHLEGIITRAHILAVLQARAELDRR